eukprot:4556991-Pyramimonas_sp.AAC.1
MNLGIHGRRSGPSPDGTRPSGHAPDASTLVGPSGLRPDEIAHVSACAHRVMSAGVCRGRVPTRPCQSGLDPD